MFDIGWSELMLIGIVALIVVGPKDLPRMFHALGQFTAKARAMARDFQYAMEQAAREAGAEDITKDLKNLKSMTSPSALGLDALSSAGAAFDRWDENKRRGIDGEPEPDAEAAAAAPQTPEHGPATAELAAKVKAKTAAAEAKAAEIASAAAQTGTEAAAKPARKPRKKAAPTAEATPEATPVAEAAARKPRTRKTAAADTPAEAAATPKPARKPRAPATRTASADAPKPKTPRKRATPGKTDA